MVSVADVVGSRVLRCPAARTVADAGHPGGLKVTPREAALLRLLRRLTGTVEIPCKEGSFDRVKVTQVHSVGDELVT